MLGRNKMFQRCGFDYKMIEQMLENKCAVLGLLKRASDEQDRLETELRQATETAKHREAAAEAFKQKAQWSREKARELEKEQAAVRQEMAALAEGLDVEKKCRQELMTALEDRYHAKCAALAAERDALAESVELLRNTCQTIVVGRDKAREEVEALQWQLARAKETMQQSRADLEFEHKACIVCMENPAHTVALPCGHRIFCSDPECNAHVETCPCCRTPMTGTLRIY